MYELADTSMATMTVMLPSSALEQCQPKAKASKGDVEFRYVPHLIPGFMFAIIIP